MTGDDAAPEADVAPIEAAAAVAARPPTSTAPSGTRTLRIFADLEIARAQVIRRAPLSEPALSEAVQAGIFRIVGIPDGEMAPVFGVVCPNVLFPYARETVSDTVTRAGFPPVLLAPVNFDAMFQQQLAQAADQAPKIQIAH